MAGRRGEEGPAGQERTRSDKQSKRGGAGLEAAEPEGALGEHAAVVDHHEGYRRLACVCVCACVCVRVCVRVRVRVRVCARAFSLTKTIVTRIYPPSSGGGGAEGGGVLRCMWSVVCGV